MFFFSSRRRHTRFKCDWSSDVCSSDLGYAWLVMKSWQTVSEWNIVHSELLAKSRLSSLRIALDNPPTLLESAAYIVCALPRSEERRVGKECRSRWSPYH